jgi:hypothetical protein
VTWAGHFRQQPTKELGMSISKWIRQVHRWLAILFTLTVIANFVAMSVRQLRGWSMHLFRHSP